MKRIVVWAVLVITLLGCCACGGGAELAVFTADFESGNYDLKWNGKTYTDFGWAEDGMWGKQFGTVEGEKYMRIFSVNGQAPEEWIVFSESTLMGGYTLYKEKSVTEIPDAFKKLAWENADS